MRRTVVGSAIGIAGAVAVGALMLLWRSHISVATAALVLVLPVVIGVVAGGFRSGLVSVAVSFLVYDLWFIPPYGTLTVGAAQNWVPLGVYLVVMLLVGQVAHSLRSTRAAAQRQESEARRLATLTELLVEGGSTEQLLETIVRAIWTIFQVDAVALLLPDGDVLNVVASAGSALTTEELQRLAPESGLPVRVGVTDPIASGLHTLVLVTGERPVGLLALRGLSASATDGALLRTFANHAALAIERAQLQTQVLRSQLLEEVDRVRRDLLGAVSHDLRTPLATMKVASSTLLDPDATLSPSDTSELYGLIDVQTDRLTRLVTSLLDMNRYQSGVLKVETQRCPVLDLIGESLAGIRPSLGTREVELEVPDAMPDVEADPVLIGQVLANLLDNAERHSPTGQPIRITAELRGNRVAVSVIDHGPGVPAAERETVFESFVGFDTGGRAGLGLAIAKTFVQAHQERVWVEDVPGGGAKFVFTLPKYLNGSVSG